MPIEVTRIVTTVIEWPPRTRTLALSIAGAERARHRCGHWPEVGDINQYLAAVRQAGREVERVEMIAGRFWRRYGIIIAEHEPLAAKWRSRHEVASETFAERSECLHLLTGPQEGSA